MRDARCGSRCRNAFDELQGYGRTPTPGDLRGVFHGAQCQTIGGLARLGPATPLSTVPILLWLTFPAIYALADFLEDLLILTLLTEPGAISDLTVNLLACFRWTKIGASSLALLQLFILGLGSGPTPAKP
jgi:hypothetical protein